MASSPPAAATAAPDAMDDGDECPVCLEPLSSASPVALPCRHAICRACVTELWEVQQCTLATWKDGHLTCPLCRASHLVGAQGLDTFLAAVAAGPATAAAAAAAKAAARPTTPRTTAVADKDGLAALTLGELKTVSQALALDGTLLERSSIEASIRDRLAAGDRAELALLPARALKAVLQARLIPHDDCVEKADLVARVAQTHRGSCKARRVEGGRRP